VPHFAEVDAQSPRISAFSLVDIWPNYTKIWKMQGTQFRQTCTLATPSLSHLCARYLQTRFRIELEARRTPAVGASMAPPAQPLLLPVSLGSELDRIALALVDAFLNPGKCFLLVDHAYRQAEAALAVKIDWDFSRYVDELPKQPTFSDEGTASATFPPSKEIRLLDKYPPLNGVKISKPCIIIDKQGIIMLWYLPGILNDSRQVGPLNLVRSPPKM
jgi:hypothetical protein